MCAGKVIHTSVSEAHAPGLHQLKEKVYSLLQAEGRLAVLAPDRTLDGVTHTNITTSNINIDDARARPAPAQGEGELAAAGGGAPDRTLDGEKQVNFVAVQLVVEPPCVVDVVFRGEGEGEAAPLQGERYSARLRDLGASFDAAFEDKFRLAEKGYNAQEVQVARAALSNMVGGLGYFYGGGRVQSEYTREPVPYWKAPLYTAVPSRSFFPRGFLWDEGFHGLLIGRWSIDIQLDIAGHWLDLINVEGWIPREQILGAEALARVPHEFVVQHNAAANPPMLLLTLAQLLRVPGLLAAPRHRAALDRMFPRLQLWYNWFLASQRGSEPSSFRWRGRVDDGRQLNPKTLTSGLDDYPRASHPSDRERHVDLRCWLQAAAAALADLAAALRRDPARFTAVRDQLADEETLNRLHWSSRTNSYADYGLHTQGVSLVRAEDGVVRAVTSPPEYQLVDAHFGYVSLFPMLLKVLSPGSDKLGKILEVLDDPDKLWSPYGLRSLSKSSPLYMARNTEHDPPYWRGQVWVNVNYLALAALRHYGTAGGPHAARALALWERLKQNV
ncbi:mannosyl-oligosaccharide glucosidase, partial [Leptidea sinapis]|uniref:mannosyl-oligosaccharide glucosidase n=1 Tax=Leptidea sinapis TaxID=189913 RepID=UPI0021C25F71